MTIWDALVKALSLAFDELIIYIVIAFFGAFFDTTRKQNVIILVLINIVALSIMVLSHMGVVL